MPPIKRPLIEIQIRAKLAQKNLVRNHRQLLTYARKSIDDLREQGESDDFIRKKLQKDLQKQPILRALIKN